MTSLDFELSAQDLSGARALHLQAGAAVFNSGLKCPGFVAVRSGVIKVSHLSPGGREITLYRVGPGDVCLQTFTCLTQDAVYSATGTAETALAATVIPKANFERLMADHAAFRARIFKAIGARFSDFQQAIETLAFTGLPARVAGALLRLSGGTAQVHATHDAIASEIGSAREAVSRLISAFVRDGLVASERGRIRILQTGALEKIRDSV